MVFWNWNPGLSLTATVIIYLFLLKDTCCQHYFWLSTHLLPWFKGIAFKVSFTNRMCQEGSGFDLSMLSLHPHRLPLIHLFSQHTAKSSGLSGKGCRCEPGRRGHLLSPQRASLSPAAQELWWETGQGTGRRWEGRSQSWSKVRGFSMCLFSPWSYLVVWAQGWGTGGHCCWTRAAQLLHRWSGLCLLPRGCWVSLLFPPPQFPLGSGTARFVGFFLFVFLFLKTK